MGTFVKLSDWAKLERFQLALTNASENPEISAALSKYGLAAESLEEGKALLASTREAYEHSKSMRNKKAFVYDIFKNQKLALEEVYSKHRKFAKILFEQDKRSYENLGLKGSYKRTYDRWIEMVKTFYSEVSENSEIKDQLAKMNITNEELESAIAAIPPLEKARADYMSEKGASQNSTEAKRAAFSKMGDWMKNFYDLSRVAFRKEPQLMESFGLVVKS